MNILIEADAFKVTGNELANLAKTEITKFVTVSIGKDILPDLIKTKNVEEVSEITDGYDDNII